MAQDPAPPTLDDLRCKRDQILDVAFRRHATRIAVIPAVDASHPAARTRIELLADFDEHATLLDQVGLSQDLAELLSTPIRVRSRRALQEHEPGSAGAAAAL